MLWFLAGGLPWILSPRDRLRSMGSRTTPFLSSMLVVALLLWVIALLFDVPEAELDRRLQETGWLLALLGCTLALAVLPIVTGFAVDRHVDGPAGQSLVVATYIGAAVGLPVLDVATGSRLYGQSLWPTLMWSVVGCALVVALTYAGIGSILAWSAKFALSRLGAVGATGGRMLPLLMIVVVIYFTGELWQWAAGVNRTRVWMAIGVLAVVALGFIAATTRDEFERILDLREDSDRHRDLLVGTPFEHRTGSSADVAGGGPGAAIPLRRSEQLNLQGKLMVAQTLQAVAITVATFIFFLILGGVMLPDGIVETWSGAPVVDTVWLGVPIPVPQAGINVALFVAVLAGLNFVVSARSDPEYREHYLDPLVIDVLIGLAARNVYRGAGARPDAPQSTPETPPGPAPEPTG